MLAHQIRATARTPGNPVTPGRDGARTVWCGGVIAAHHTAMERDEQGVFPGSAPSLSPGEPRTPGLVEVCKHCALYRGTPQMLERRLVVLDRKPAPPDWYLDDRKTQEHRAQGASAGESLTPDEDPGSETADPSQQQASEKWRVAQATWGRTWPHPRGELVGRERATVSFLFSGGVFRGV
jgi:hypothetical protein